MDTEKEKLRFDEVCQDEHGLITNPFEVWLLAKKDANLTAKQIEAAHAIIEAFKASCERSGIPNTTYKHPATGKEERNACFVDTGLLKQLARMGKL